MSRRHEQLLFRYSSALERGEFEIVAEVLREAEHDPALERAILEMNEVYAAERAGSTNHVNHKNHREKEVPMTVALYRRRANSPVQWQSLPLVAALAVIAVLTLMLAAQIRQNSTFNTGNGNGDVPALAQGSALCEGAVLAVTDVHTRDNKDSVVVGTLPAGAHVKALEAGIHMLDEAETGNGQNWALWLFIMSEGADGVQGWIPATALDPNDCPRATIGQMITATPTVFSMTATPLPSLTPTAADVLYAQPTATPVPFSGNGVQSALVTQYTFAERCNAVTRATTDVLSEPSWDAQVLMSVPRGIEVSVSDYAVSVDAQGRQEAWYFGAMNDGTGWMLASLLDAAACPAVSSLTAAEGTVPPSFSIVPMQFATVVPAEVQPIDPALGTALPPTVPPPNYALPTFTPSPAAFTLAQATVVPEVHVITLPPTIEATAGTYNFGYANCYVNTGREIHLYESPSNDSRLIEVLPTGAKLQIIASNRQLGTAWLWTAYKPSEASVVLGYITADSVVMPSSGCQAPEFTVSAVPVDTPLQLQPTVVTLGTLPVQATPQYYVYVVQPGDTLLSIMARFGLDRSALPDVLRANNLTEDSVIAPGITLYVPTSQQLITLACKITAARTLELRVRPTMDAALIGSLPVGAEFELIDRSEQRDGVWYAIAAQVEGVTVRGAWVSPGAITVPTDCQSSVPGTVITVLPADDPTSVPTVLPMPTATLGR